MTFQEKSLYHQIHPVKLITDWLTGIIALYFFWQHRLVLGVIIAILPSICASLFLVTLTDLTYLKQSKLGKYMKKYMTKHMEILRSIGYLPMVIGAWFHLFILIPIGLCIILFAWFRGYIVGRKA